MTAIPDALAEIIDDFASVSAADRVTLLVEFSRELPDLPAELTTAAMEPVPECQSPVFLKVDASDVEHVRLYFSAPLQAPTTRGFASILFQGLDSAAAADILAVPDDFAYAFGLAEVISPLRLRGMTALLARVKNQIRGAA